MSRKQQNTRRETYQKKIKTPISMTKIPELDATEELNKDDVTLYHELIGILRWATEIGRVDILLEVSLLSQYQANPREGLHEQLLHIFGFFRKYPKLTLYLSPELPNMAYGNFHTQKTSPRYIEMRRN
jgi:hypothetical protein